MQHHRTLRCSSCPPLAALLASVQSRPVDGAAVRPAQTMAGNHAEKVQIVPILIQKVRCMCFHHPRKWWCCIITHVDMQPCVACCLSRPPGWCPVMYACLLVLLKPSNHGRRRDTEGLHAAGHNEAGALWPGQHARRAPGAPLPDARRRHLVRSGTMEKGTMLSW